MILKKYFVFILLAILIVLYLFYPKTWDITKDKRYSLSNTSHKILKKVNTPIQIDVFLSGDLPNEYQKINTEVRQLLLKLSQINKNIQFDFIDPFKEISSNNNKVISVMSQFEMYPEYVYNTTSQTVSKKIIFPWAVISQNKQSVKAKLLQKKIGSNKEQIVTNSIEQLEYLFIDGIAQILTKERKQIAILSSHNTSPFLKIKDFIVALQKYYDINIVDLKKNKDSINKTFKELVKKDLLIVSNPTQKFTEKEKYIIDQFHLNGGKSAWFIDQVLVNKDSLFNEQGTTITTANNLNLEDYFFRLGIRINYDLIKDIYCSPIVLANGNNNETQYQPFPWVYHPLAIPNKTHQISTGLNAVNLQFATPIDTLKNKATKQILLNSSPMTDKIGLYNKIEIINTIESINENTFNSGIQNFGVLIEGELTSFYNNRPKPFNLDTVIKKEGTTKIVVISDGNVAENQIDKNKALSLGYDKWTNNFYDNKDFLMNSVKYLLDDNGTINSRKKKIQIPFLDVQKIKEEKKKYQIIIIVIPLLFFGIITALLLYFKRFNFVKRN